MKLLLSAYPPRSRRAGWMAVVSFGLSYLAGRLLARKQKSPVETDKPTPLALRGSKTSWFVGIQEVAPVLSWVGLRFKRREKVEGAGKGFSTPKQDVWYEEGRHDLAVGPVRALHYIKSGGKVIWSGPITSESHPSGSTITIEGEGIFDIYWGEPDQPVNMELADASRYGIASRWPHSCYIYWREKRLGTRPVWPDLKYVMERRPSTSLLTQSDGWYEPDWTPSGVTHVVEFAEADADPEVGYLALLGDQTFQYVPDAPIRLNGTGITDGDYIVRLAEVNQVVTGTNDAGLDTFTTYTFIYLTTGTAGVTETGAGTTEYFTKNDQDGANIAHIISEALFADWPLGLGLDPTVTSKEPWDLDSLEALGVEAEDDGWRSAVLGVDGETFEALLQGMLQDHGVMLPINASGEWTFQRVREPSGPVASIPENYLDNNPEIISRLGALPVDRILFSFTDRKHYFSSMTLGVNDSGHVIVSQYPKARQVPLISTVHFPTASKLVELRGPEEMSQASVMRLRLGRDARNLLPGDPFTLHGFDEVLRVLAIKIDPLSEVCEVNAIPDYYGVPKTTFEHDEGGDPLEIEPTVQNPAQGWLELPDPIIGFPEDMQVLALGIRAHDQISSHNIWISRDNSSYTLWGEDPFIQTGGALQTALAADGATFLAQGPEYDELGPDNASLTQDLSGDLTNWALGRQIAAIVSTAGTELCTLQKATITGAGVRRLDGLSRARYGTRKLDHPAGALVFIFDRDAVSGVLDPLLEPEEELWIKLQPTGPGGTVSLAAVAPYGQLLYGHGQRPQTPDFLTLTAPFKGSLTFETGDDLDFRWGLVTGSIPTGAGGSAAGTAIGDPVIPGLVEIELLTTGNASRGFLSIDPSNTWYTLTNAALVAAFTGEPSAFKARVRHIANGLPSDWTDSITITRV